MQGELLLPRDVPIIIPKIAMMGPLSTEPLARYPKRLQRSRKRGAKTPKGAPYVGSPRDLGATWSLEVFDGIGHTVGERQAHRFEVAGWPFSEDDEPHLWWTLLPDLARIQTAIKRKDG